MSKRNVKDLVQTLLRDGDIKEVNGRGQRTYIIVEYGGQKFWIDNPYGDRPKLTQLSKN